MIHSREPIKKIADDKLNRKCFAEEISNTIENLPDNNSYAICVNGKWGSGKTTVINFTKELLMSKKTPNAINDVITKISIGKDFLFHNKKSKLLSKISDEFYYIFHKYLYKNSYVIIDFNPWIYSNQDNLTKSFFETIACNISNHNYNKIVKKLFLVFSSTIFYIIDTIFIPSNNFFPITIKGLIRKYDYFLNHKKTDLNYLKNKISKKLIKTNKKYVVIIDDIDRLDKSEVVSIMKLVRSVADFQNTVYILSYDETIVSKMLSMDNIYSGTDYLPKIIQQTFTIPDNKTYFTKLFDNTFKHIINGDVHFNHTGFHDDNGVEYTYKDQVFDELYSLSHDSLNIRSINILMDRFSTKYNLSASNTHPVDLLAITYIEIYYPALIQWIKNHSYDLLRNNYFKDEKEITPKEIYLKDGLKLEYIELMNILFPFFENSEMSFQNISNYGNRICVDSYFNNYFSLIPDLLEWPNSLIEGILNHYSPKQIEMVILEYQNKNKLPELMNILDDNYYKINEKRGLLLIKIICFDSNYVTNDFGLQINPNIYPSYGMLYKYVIHFVQDDVIFYSYEKNNLEAENFIKNLFLQQLEKVSIENMFHFLYYVIGFSRYNNGIIPHERAKNISSTVLKKSEQIIKEKYMSFKNPLESKCFYGLVGIIYQFINEDLAETIVNTFITNIKDVQTFLSVNWWTEESWIAVKETLKEELRNDERVKSQIDGLRR